MGVPEQRISTLINTWVDSNTPQGLGLVGAQAAAGSGAAHAAAAGVVGAAPG